MRQGWMRCRHRVITGATTSIVGINAAARQTFGLLYFQRLHLWHWLSFFQRQSSFQLLQTLGRDIAIEYTCGGFPLPDRVALGVIGNAAGLLGRSGGTIRWRFGFFITHVQ